MIQENVFKIMLCHTANKDLKHKYIFTDYVLSTRFSAELIYILHFCASFTFCSSSQSFCSSFSFPYTCQTLLVPFLRTQRCSPSVVRLSALQLAPHLDRAARALGHNAADYVAYSYPIPAHN